MLRGRNFLLPLFIQVQFQKVQDWPQIKMDGGFLNFNLIWFIFQVLCFSEEEKN